jgi:NADPH:quinone reductase-like Zn-dependent oxidoreductase
MRAAAIDRFGGPEVLETRVVEVPEVGTRDVMIKVAAAGVGVWEPWLLKGGMAGKNPRFPMVLGSDGAGTVERVGDKVDAFEPGDRVYGYGFQSPKGGFYAEYAVLDADLVAKVPESLSLEQAGVLAADGVTAIRGLDDALELRPGQALMVFGASGGLGHIAVQLGKRIGARVFAVASGSDGVAMVKKLGADKVVDGHEEDVLAAARNFAPEGLDAVLACAGGDTLDKALGAVRRGGRVAYPNGVEPAPARQPGVDFIAFDGLPSPRVLQRLNELIEAGPFDVHVDRTYDLDEAAEAHRHLSDHFLGKIALTLNA